jgi:hypothetical protein
MPQQYIDDFFQRGELRLSSFAAFGQLPNERRDPDEGRNRIVVKGKDFQFHAVMRNGLNSYILCASTIATPIESLKPGEGIFRIRDTAEFGVAIASRLPTFCDGLEGHCEYGDVRSIEHVQSDFSLATLRASNQSDELDLDKMMAIARTGGAKVFFVKRSEFRPESEYRFVWNVHDDTGPFIDIVCPNARQYCEKIS